jgi:multiple sugar transport system permease protein
MARKRQGLDRSRRIQFWLFVSPWLIGFLILGVGPILSSICLSFCEWDIFTPAEWVGFRNYEEMFADDPLFWTALYNTAWYTVVAVPLGVIVSLSLAVLLNTKIRGVAVYRTLYFLPSILSGVAVALLWRWFFNPDFGMLNAILAPIIHGIEGVFHLVWSAFSAVTGSLGIGVPREYPFEPMGPPGWLTSPVWSKPALVLMSLWGAGGGMVIFLAALQGVPEELYEVAEIDGAGRWQRFRNVTLPMISPVMFFVTCMGIIGSFQVFTQVYIMTGGGPSNSTLFYVLYLFNNAFSYFRMGYASAMAWVLFVIILVVTIVQFRLARRWVHYES